PETSHRTVGLLAVAACILAVAASGARGQSAVAAPVKNPMTAAAIAVFIPGGGHMYAGEPIRGFALLAATASVATWAVTSSKTVHVDYACQVRDCTDKSQNPNYQTLEVGLGVAGALWLVSVLDAPRAANRANARNRLRQMASTGFPLVGLLSVAPVVVRVNGKVSPGLGISATF
ncbi:MAG: hypothetical protein ACRENC_12580, partial [Gemmatimonadaceae bacterium]